MNPVDLAERLFGPEPDWPGPIPPLKCPNCHWPFPDLRTAAPLPWHCRACGWHEDPL
jgi:hypothetical protein